MDDLKRARLLAVEVLLADPEALHNDALETDLYILRDTLQPEPSDNMAEPQHVGLLRDYPEDGVTGANMPDLTDERRTRMRPDPPGARLRAGHLARLRGE